MGKGGSLFVMRDGPEDATLVMALVVAGVSCDGLGEGSVWFGGRRVIGLVV